MHKILIIEDDKIKIERLSAFFKNDHFTIKESYQSGMIELKGNSDKYDFLILDMTIPIWEKGNNDLGGNYEQFGGERVLRELKRKSISIPTILFTMFDVFPTKEGNITFEEMDANFKTKFPNYCGAVFYSGNEDNWKNNLLTKINQIYLK